MNTKEAQQFWEESMAIAKAFTIMKNKDVDDYCDKNNVSDEMRREFKKVNKIKVYSY